MTTYSRPGVYINELPLTAAPINSTSVANAAGACIAAFPQGPDAVTRVTSWYEFQSRFGGYSSKYPATFSVASFFTNGGTELYVKRILPTAAKAVAKAVIPTQIVSGQTSSTTLATIAAKFRGIDGNNLRVKFSESNAVRQAGYFDLSVYIDAGVSDYVGSTFTPANAGDDVLVEQFNGVVFNDPTSSDYIKTVLDYGSAYIKVLEGPVTEYSPVDGTPISPVVTYTTNNLAGRIPSYSFIPLTGAPDPEVALTYADYTGDTSGTDGGVPTSPVYSDCTVFKEFEVIQQPLVFFLPDVDVRLDTGWTAAKVVYNMLSDFANFTKKDFVVAETVAGLTPDLAVGASGELTESSRMAVYYPNFYVKDPMGHSSAAVRLIGPSGAVAGLYLGTDSRVGPFKSPAGIDARIQDAVALERAFSPTDLDVLNSGVTSAGVSVGKNVVNAIRNIPGAGVVIMGGRTTKQDGTANKYVNMRRSLIYIEKRLNDLLQFAVFENNSERLWSRINTTLGVFLNDYRNQGGLRGGTPDESFYVKCDAENNSSTSIAAGEVHVEVGVALEYPAEFVVLNLSQKTI
jgi:hypothetical protein